MIKYHIDPRNIDVYDYPELKATIVGHFPKISHQEMQKIMLLVTQTCPNCLAKSKHSCHCSEG
jgi:hypothetical protein